MAGKPAVIIPGAQGQGQDLGEVEDGKLIREGAPGLQIELAHGATGDQALGARGHGALHDLIHQRRHRVRPGDGEIAAAAAVGQGLGQRFGPQTNLKLGTNTGGRSALPTFDPIP